MNFCIIGSRGHVGYVFDSIAKVPEVKLTAIASGSEDTLDRLQDFASKAGFAPKAYDDWKVMLDTEKPDVAAVDGPFHLHGEMTAYALERGIHVFCEKPIALTHADLDKIRKAQAKTGARLLSMVGLRYEPDFQYALHLVKSGAIGKVKLVKAQKSYRFGTRPDFYRSRELYGGTIPWVGSHALDWIMAFSGSFFKSVYASHTTEDNFGYGELEVACQCMFLMKNGVQAQASIDFLRPMAAPTHGDDRVRVVGTTGVLEVIKGKIMLIDKDGEREIAVPAPEREIFSDFIHAIEGRGEMMVPESETFELTKACLLARDSADKGEVLFF